MAIQKVTSSLIADNSVGLSQLNLSDGSNGQFLQTNGSGTLSFAAAGGGGGAWTVISSSTVSSSVSAVEISLTGSYTRYAINWQGANFGSTASFMCFQFKEGTDSSFHSVMYIRNGYGTNTGSFSANVGSTTSSDTAYPQTNALVNSSSGSCSGLMEIHNVPGMPAAFGYAMTNETGSKLGYTNFVVKLGSGVQAGDKFGAVSFAPASGNVEAGTFTLYGLDLS